VKKSITGENEPICNVFVPYDKILAGSVRARVHALNECSAAPTVRSPRTQVGIASSRCCVRLESVEEARALLGKLPLDDAKLMEFDFIELGPLSPPTYSWPKAGRQPVNSLQHSKSTCLKW
jgi:hypothetical protein